MLCHPAQVALAAVAGSRQPLKSSSVSVPPAHFQIALLFACGAEPQKACAGASGAAGNEQAAMSSDGEPQQAQVIELSSDDEFSSRRSLQVE